MGWFTEVAVTAVIAGTVGAGLTGIAIARTPDGDTLTVQAVGIQEDDPGWDCRRDGDRVCGPTNDQGVEVGCYTEGSIAHPLAPWPCHVEVDTDGEGSIYSGYPVWWPAGKA